MSAAPSIMPLVIGHRGSSAVAPENTIAAFVRAFRDGADGIEFDVRLASDGVPVIIHDATLQRTGQMPGQVSDFTAAVLGRIGVGSWFNERYPDAAKRKYEEETIPSLVQLFRAVADRPGLLYLEMKSEGQQAERLATAVLMQVKEFKLSDRVIVESFDLSALEIVRRIDPTIRTAALFEPRLKRPLSVLQGSALIDLAVKAGAGEVALHRNLIRKRVVARATSLGLPIVVWTVDDPVWIDRARSLGIKALITNDPHKMVQARSRG